MRRPNPFVMIAGLAVFLVSYGGLPLLKGGLFLDTHEGDTYHMLDILLRIEAGLIPHLDFPTPLGVLAFWPVSEFVAAGQSAGRAIVLGQLAVAAGLLLPVVYVGITRFSAIPAWLFGVLTLGLSVALSYGGAAGGASISMHYNRWAWALAFVAVALAVLPARGRDRPVTDGFLVGLLGGALALLKATYFVALGPGVLVAVVLRWRGTGLLAALAGGAVVALWATLSFGAGVWGAYLGDLRVVLASEVRPFVGVPLNTIIAGTGYLGLSLLGVAVALMVRRFDGAAGLALLLLLPGFIYVTYQNFGNDPQWIWLLGLIAWQLRPAPETVRIAGQDLRLMLGAAAVMALALNLPALFSLAASNVNHAAFDRAAFLPMLPSERGHQDIHIRRDRAHMMTAQVDLDREQTAWAAYAEKVARAPLAEFGGLRFPACEWQAGSRGFFERLSADLAAADLPPGSQLFVADILSAFWLFGDFAPLENGAPWYYGGLSGLENADYLLIPKCSFVARVRGIMIADLNAADGRFDLRRDNELYALFSVDYERPAQSASSR